MMETRVVEVARVRAAVKSAHIRALKARLREKKVWMIERDRDELLDLIRGIFS